MIAVSKTSDPTGQWAIYSVPVQDDGTDGTPDHGCEGGPCPGRLVPSTSAIRSCIIPAITQHPLVWSTVAVTGDTERFVGPATISADPT